jgi:hypothetical protein
MNPLSSEAFGCGDDKAYRRNVHEPEWDNPIAEHRIIIK